ncbi:TetR family transcriptional regulator [Roseobacter sp. HKCCD9010]|uniref:TetR/AcrR family transcriptional regulator n=1 Tax=unclassified Roseobacter TaxID=196798 RepID=UPI001490F31A|nr:MULTISPECIES: TetR/AcrR family transcriptional regulator [unclassified Roseobacter]MBF9051102.1 TetR family transcriptional regulator [Rhodobacterales bacterium HKCCD4356]NNV12871.1 TetR family transcriptional regulator [Roseobacter sp. HKCCD7357]NNV16816.1 TetR family transcriptional regulator [Roseobacter sp. HKCCD8768]NNV26552.1 TetR family transcriptional regulator [Roseobacter sp. HKCCD8192]NNV30537.1 TetR family transcriptional regulator [Roseobacter sp. HKCCD9061]
MARPRAFDPKEALDQILSQFWAGGYHATSLQDLERVTGLKKQSLYREFGNKDAMFAAALGLYGDREMAVISEILQSQDTPQARISALFDAILAPVHHGDRRGCFLCNTAIEHAPDDPEVQAYTAAGIAATKELFAQALSLTPNAEAKTEADARRLTSGYFGIRVMVRGGVPLPELQATAEALVAGIKS